MARSNATTPEDVIGRVIAHAGPDEHSAAFEAARGRAGGKA